MALPDSNRESFLTPLIFLVIGLSFAMIPLMLYTVFDHRNNELKTAYDDYSAGETAHTIAERTHAFNQALTVYTKLEENHHPFNGDGKLYYNMGNTYFQLEEYPLAVYYYYQAQALMPRNHNVEFNLKEALAKLSLSLPIPNTFLQRFFFFHTFFSQPERYQLFALFGFLTLLFGMLFIWQKRKWFKRLIIIFLFCWLLMFFSLLYSIFIAPLQGVVIISAALYRDAGLQYAKVQEQPIAAGIKVDVVDQQQEGKWLKILTSDGTMGYISYQNVRLIK